MFILIVRRFFLALIVLWFLATVTFLMLRYLPGGPFDSEKALPPEVKANINARYGLDLPLHTQYFRYLTKLIQGDLGESFNYIGRPIRDIVCESLPNSLFLGLWTFGLCCILSLLLGVVSVFYHNRLPDKFLTSAAATGLSLPSFILGPLLVLIFADQLNWLPPALWEGKSITVFSFRLTIPHIQYLLLPLITLGGRPFAYLFLLLRNELIETSQSDFIRTARAKGLPEILVIGKHLLRNSLTSLISISGPMVAGLITGSFVVELIFAIPGMGKYFVQAVSNRDYPLVLGVTLVYGIALILSNLVSDILHITSDPRVKIS